jgi:hypothetical protein
MQPYLIRQAAFWSLLVVFSQLATAQQPAGSNFVTLPLQDMQAFRKPDANWKIAGSARADLNKDEVLNTGSGTGVLVNLPDKKDRGNLLFQLEHGDLDLDLEFMMARHSNSGIYLQGRYEVQLFDSWGVQSPSFSDCGGIYERWDDARPVNEKGYEGWAPRANSAHAPGLWQKMHIEFSAPRFDGAGHKIANARIIRLELNGVLLHENLELTGPTRGAAFPGESARGALLIQGDHGPVAFRNIRYRMYDQAPARLENLTYKVYQGEYGKLPDLSKLTAVASGKTPVLTQEVGRMNEKMLVVFNGTLKAPAAGAYRFNMTAYGYGSLKIGDKQVIAWGSEELNGRADLPAGDVPVEIIYSKPANWYPNGLALMAEGPGFRPTPLSSLSSLAPSNPDRPITVTVGEEPEVLRSFMDYAETDTGKTHRIVRAISVGFLHKTSVSYNAANGALYQGWKGGFLDASPMWNSRGDGSTRPIGDLLRLGDRPTLVRLPSPDAVLPDTMPADAAYRFYGYDFDPARWPTFRYEAYGYRIGDKITEHDKSVSRDLWLDSKGTVKQLYFRIATGATIEALPDNWFIVDGRYYIQVKASEEKPIVHKGGGKQALLVPVPVKQGSAVSYSLTW